MMDFDGKVALVTGGGAGIGRATALAFAQRGARVVVADVFPQAGEETVGLIERAGGEAFSVRCDVASEEEIQAAIRAAVEKYGGLDFAANNAGISGEAARITSCTNENWAKVIDIDLRGVWLCLKHEIPQMIERGGGAIVNTSSMCGITGTGTPPYVSAKHGIIGLTKNAALEVASNGIRVNAVCPGIIRTASSETAWKSSPDVMARLEGSIPMGRVGEPEQVANTIVWLCSDDASYITGVYIPVDGGFVAR